MQNGAPSVESAQIPNTEQATPQKLPVATENEHRIAIKQTIDKVSEYPINKRQEKNSEVIQRVTEMGEDDAHKMLPFLKESLLDNEPYFGSSQAFAQIHRAIAKGSQRDMDISIAATQTLLNRENTSGNGAFTIAETLIKQVYEHRRNNGNLNGPVKDDILMDRVSEQLKKILKEYKKGGGYIGRPEMKNPKVGNEATRIMLLNALAMTGTDGARQFISNRDNYDIQGMLDKDYFNSRLAQDALDKPELLQEYYEAHYDIETPLHGNAISKENPTEVQEHIEQIRDEIKEEINNTQHEELATGSESSNTESTNTTSNTKDKDTSNITDISSAKEKKESSIDSHRLSSENSDYESQWVTYDVPNAKALYDHLKSPRYLENGMTSALGPALEKGHDKNPKIVYDASSGHMDLRLPLPKSLQGIDFRKDQNHTQPFLEEFPFDVQKTISPQFNRFTTDRHDSRIVLRKIDNQQSGWGVASIVGNELRLNLNNLGEHIARKPAESLADFKIALENALRLHRDFVTEALKTTREGNTDPSSIEPINVVLDPNWQESKDSMLAS